MKKTTNQKLNNTIQFEVAKKEINPQNTLEISFNKSKIFCIKKHVVFFDINIFFSPLKTEA